MKKLALISTMVVSTAFPAWSFAQQGDPSDACEIVSTMATSIMGARQNGVTMQEVMRIRSSNSINDVLDELLDDMVVDAYEHPRYSTENMQKLAVSDFNDKWYLPCVKALRKK